MAKWCRTVDDGLLELYAKYKAIRNEPILTGSSQRAAALVEYICENYMVDLARSAVMVDRTLPAKYKRAAQAFALCRCKRAIELMRYDPSRCEPFKYFNRICHNERKRQRTRYDADMKKRAAEPFIESLDEVIHTEKSANPGGSHSDQTRGDRHEGMRTSDPTSQLDAAHRVRNLRRLSPVHAAIIESIRAGDGQTNRGDINLRGIARDTRLSVTRIQAMLTEIRVAAAIA